MKQTSTGKSMTIGMDLGDRYSQVCVLNQIGEVIEEGQVRSTPEALRTKFGVLDPCLIVIEAGSHSPWVSRLLEGLGHDCLVANPAALASGKRRKKKSDKVDARKLARKGFSDPQELEPIRHRSEAMQLDMSLLLGRRALVRARTSLINSARGLVKSYGGRLPSADAHSFPEKVRGHVPEQLQDAIAPLLRSIETLSEQIAVSDKRVDQMAENYGEATSRMRQVRGVGPLIASAFVLVIQDPGRFSKSRQVGAYVGLAPGQDKSGEHDPELPISKAGNAYLRELLLNGAHYILGPFGPDCDLRRWGLQKAIGGKKAKKRAVVAVARKLAVLLHRLWQSGADYVPLRRQHALEVMPATV